LDVADLTGSDEDFDSLQNDEYDRRLGGPMAAAGSMQ
jgi:hypothetical protein